jgi:hypothetical protein
MADIDICNLALIRLGQEPITSLTEGTNQAQACNLLYPSTRDKVLSWTLWPFATTRQQLSRLTATPASDYAYFYAMPTIPYPLRIVDIDTASLAYQREIWIDPTNPFNQIPVLLTDATAVIVKYIARTSEGVWSPLFVDTLSLWLALDLAPAVTGKQSLRDTLQKELDLQLRKLEAEAGHQDEPRRVRENTAYLEVR